MGQHSICCSSVSNVFEHNRCTSLFTSAACVSKVILFEVCMWMDAPVHACTVRILFVAVKTMVHEAIFWDRSGKNLESMVLKRQLAVGELSMNMFQHCLATHNVQCTTTVSCTLRAQHPAVRGSTGHQDTRDPEMFRLQ